MVELILPTSETTHDITGLLDAEEVNISAYLRLNTSESNSLFVENVTGNCDLVITNRNFPGTDE